ncbi:hypothetical protein [uncultured Hymenobacter sp.]|uniref:hypothetical protein n=1 Tax=uncultured Hymenobacter sp. TaxID=170016 RepID=UPI0035CC5474
MDTLSTAIPPTRPNGPNLWQWLLRSVGLEAWFQQTPVGTQAGREERVFLQLALPGISDATNASKSALLTEALGECLTAIQAGGGKIASCQGGSLLLTWPVELGEQQVVSAYFLLRERVRHLTRHQELFGAASLGWVTLRQARAGLSYQGEVVNQVAGILRENQQSGYGLLISAALHHRLDQTLPFRHELHVGFNLPSHRYPATLFRVTSELTYESDQPRIEELASATSAERVPYLPCL